MRFATHRDFVEQHLSWTFSLRKLPDPRLSEALAWLFDLHVFVCTAERDGVRLCVVSEERAAAWLELTSQVERAEALS